MNASDSADEELGNLPGVGPALLKKFQLLGIETVTDLVETLPFRLEDRSRVMAIKDLRADEEVVVRGSVSTVSTRRSKRGTLIIDVKIEDQSGKISALWFNQRYLLKFLKPGRELFLFGSKRLSKPLGNPFFVKAIIDEPAIVPFYHLTAGLGQPMYRKILRQARPMLEQQTDLIPPKVAAEFNLPAKASALLASHFEPTETTLAASRELLAFEELLLLALSICRARKEQTISALAPVAVDPKLLRQFVESLPFQLTDGQRRVAWEIIQDMTAGNLMNRLLYGEVGSGKTAVAAVVTAAMLQQNRAAVFLAPTTALAAQQAMVLRRWFPSHQVALVIGAHKDRYDEADIIVGTQALLQDSVRLPHIGLVVVDEQHRFGVRERQHLLNRHPQAHLLMMTATPIPRSFAQTFFGHLNISYLLDKPVHQQPIKTVIVASSKRTEAETEIAERLSRGEPGYVICPLIEPPDEIRPTLFTLEKKAVTSEQKRLTERFPNAKIAVLHGRLKAAQKEQILSDFRAGKIDILLSTTVVEVGIDNPSATWILIEDADHFGLSQLHQLRGRVGRGDKTSVCYLVSSQPKNPRLQALLDSDSGLELSEKDLELRGPGELIGAQQSGLPSFRYADWHNVNLIRAVFAVAEPLLTDLDQYPALKKRLEMFYSKRNELAGV